MNHDVIEAQEHFTAEYAKAVAKYQGLPSLEVLDKEFDIVEVIGREKHFPRNALRYTRWFLSRFLDGWVGYLHQFILPNQYSAISMEEYNHFSEKEKEGIISLMNWLMYQQRYANTIQLDENDDETAKFITQLFAGWLERKHFFKTILEKNRDVWQKKAEKK